MNTQKTGKVSRRLFLGGAVSSAAALTAASAMHAFAAEADDSVTLEVYNPSGSIEIKYMFAKRLDTLEGKTIAQVGNSWEGYRVHPLIEKLLKERYKNITIIPFGEMPDYPDMDKVVESAKAKGVDAVIIGNAA